ncbi:hypothetical protein pb186bvf_005100 [Paramecium bursaria]
MVQEVLARSFVLFSNEYQKQLYLSEKHQIYLKFITYQCVLKFSLCESCLVPDSYLKLLRDTKLFNIYHPCQIMIQSSEVSNFRLIQFKFYFQFFSLYILSQIQFIICQFCMNEMKHSLRVLSFPFLYLIQNQQNKQNKQSEIKQNII